MALSIAERKHRLPYGAVKEIAAIEHVSSATVSRVLSETWRPQTDEGRATERRVRVRIARKLGMRVDDVFPPPPPAPAPQQEAIAGVA